MANEDKIRVIEDQPVKGASGILHISDFAGPSGASKPTSGVANGSTFMETDTGDIYIFDETSVAWTKL